MAYPYPSTAESALPVVPPMTQVPPSVPTYAQVLPSSAQPAPQAAPLPAYPTAAEILKETQRTLLTWGTFGVILGAGAQAVVTALAFQSFKRSKNKSVWKPALWVGAGSLIAGGTLLYILSRSIDNPLDQRLAAATIGATLAK